MLSESRIALPVRCIFLLLIPVAGAFLTACDEHVDSVAQKESTSEVSSSGSLVMVDRADYYASVNGTKREALKAALQNLLELDHHQLSYRQLWEALQYTDEDPDNIDNVILFYTGRSHSKADRDGQPGANGNSWNREHIWPKSMGFMPRSFFGHTDLHHIRPTDKSVNRSRGSFDFDNGGDPQGEAPDTFSDGDSWEPRDAVKGDVARMIFYMDVRYDGSDGNMPDLRIVNDTRSETGDPVIGVLCTLYRWHWDDPVDAFEMRRNDRVQEWQGNRNPLIDHPEWVEELYGAECGP